MNFKQPRKRFVLNLHYNESNGFLFVNATNIYHLKSEDSEIKDYTLCSNKIFRDFRINNMKKTELKVSVNFFLLILILLIPYDVLAIHKYLMKGT